MWLELTPGTGERKEYAGTLPLCNRIVGIKSAAARGIKSNLTCYECGNLRALQEEVNKARGARDTLVVVILEVNSIKDLVALHIWGKRFLLSMGPFFILDKLAEVVESSRLTDKMKVVFDQTRREEASLEALIHDACCSLRVSLSKKRRLATEFEALRE
ncbi:hypothetical protein Tco_0140686 [Tanacetum coccineum]